jgi:hypothetical protein
MSTDTNDTGAALREALKSMGHKVDDNPFDALDIETHETETRGLDPEEPSETSSGELRRTPGGIFDEGEADANAQLPEKDPWSRTLPGLGKVTVNESEREDYWRALWAETPFNGTVMLALPGVGDMHFVFRSLSQGSKEIVAVAVDRLLKEHPVKTADALTLAGDYYMRIRVILQLVRWWNDGSKREFLPYDAVLDPDELAENSPHVATLIKLGRTWFNTWSESSLKTVFKALHAFETKVVIMEDAAINQDF